MNNPEDAALDMVREGRSNAYELPWEIIRNALRHCLEKKSTHEHRT